MSHLLFTPLLSPYKKLIVVLLLLTASLTNSYAATYLLEPNHSNVLFSIDHFKTSTNTGGFYHLTGQLEYDKRAQTGSVSLIIPMHTLRTGNKAFDINLGSADFFDINQFPLASFVSTQWYFSNAKGRSNVTKVDGLLTLHGKTNPVTLAATKFNCYLSPIIKKSVCGGDFTTTIDRKKWGISKYTFLGITEKVTLNIQIEAVKQ